MTFFNRNVSLTNTYHLNCFRVFTRRCRHWDPLNRNTCCLVALVTCVLHAVNRFVVVVLWVVQHYVSHVDVGERVTTSKTGRLIYVHKRTLGSRGWVETLQPITTRQPTMHGDVTTNHNSTNTNGDTTIHFLQECYFWYKRTARFRKCLCVSVCANFVPFHRHHFVKFLSYFIKPVHQLCIISQLFQRFTAITLSISLIFRVYMP